MAKGPARRGQSKPSGSSGLIFGVIPLSYVIVFVVVLTSFQGAVWLHSVSTRSLRAASAASSGAVAASGAAAAGARTSGAKRPKSGPPANPAYTQTLSVCNNNCASANDGVCDDMMGTEPRGQKSRFPKCELGTDCADCGAPRKLSQDYAAQKYILQMQKEGIEVRIRDTTTVPKFKFAYTDPKADADVSLSMEVGGQVERGETIVFHRILSEVCPPGPDGKPGLFMDVGANFGYYAIYAARHGCRVRAYEPVPLIYRFLRLNVELNGLQDVIETFPYAVGNESFPIKIYAVDPKDRTGQNWGTASTLYVGKDRPFYEAKQVSLDDEVPSDTIGLLKVDVEGFEPNVFSGARELFKERRVLNLLMEYSPGAVAEPANLWRAPSFPEMLMRFIDDGFELGVLVDEFSKGGRDFRTDTNYQDFAGVNTPIPAFPKVTKRILQYDLRDVYNFMAVPQNMGGRACRFPDNFDEIKKRGWDKLHHFVVGCGRIPEDLDPRSLHSMFSFNTNILGSLKGGGIKLEFNGEAGIFDASDSVRAFFGKGQMGSGMRMCHGFETEDVALGHRCPCSSFKRTHTGNSPQCLEKEALIRQYGSKGWLYPAD